MDVSPRESTESTSRTSGEHRVVVGVDGSAGARAALRYALVAAARRNAALDVVAAYPVGLPWRWEPSIDAPDVEAVRADLEARARSFGADVRAEIAGVEHVPVRVVTGPGHAATVLLEAAEGAELLVVGGRGRGVARSAILGSVALHVVTAARCPVVVVHEGRPEAATGPVVVGMDDAPDAPAVIGAALDEAARAGADLHVVAAFQGGDHWTDESAEAGPSPQELQARVQQRIDAVVAEVTAQAARRLGDRRPAVRTAAVYGSPYEVLSEATRDARLLVVGSHGHGHGAVRGLLLGSVALHAVASSRIPVMVVHPAAVPAPGTGVRETVPG